MEGTKKGWIERVDGRDQGWLDAGHGEWTCKGKERREDGKNNL